MCALCGFCRVNGDFERSKASVCARACEREQTCTLDTAAQNSSPPVQVCPHVTAVRSRSRREDDRILGPHLLCNFLFVSIASKNIFAQTQLRDKLKGKAHDPEGL